MQENEEDFNENEFKEINFEEEFKGVNETKEEELQRKEKRISILQNQESTLSSVLPLSKVNVNFPFQKSNKIINYFSFEIEFCWNEIPLKVMRRYSNIEMLRAAILTLIPFSYLPSIHYKKLMMKNDFQFLQFRTDQLNIFFKFIQENLTLFNICDFKSTDL